jgi:Sulfotransferase family
MERAMILCAGMQSGGTTLVSWCFLQRRDTDGELDMANDGIRASFDRAEAPIVWCKMTIGCFRWLDVAEFYGDLGWDPTPLLVVRDVRAVLASLLRKPYGFNGKTGDRPPLRMRLRRFLRDWELFRQHGWPTIQFEELLADPEGALRRACDALELAWDDGMVSWPKAMSQIAYPSSEPNATFVDSIGHGALRQALLSQRRSVDVSGLPAADLEWVEEAFAVYNKCHGYPLHVAPGKRDDGAGPPLHERIIRAEREYERARGRAD